MTAQLSPIFKEWNEENISEIQRQMIQTDANATGRTSRSLRADSTDDSTTLFGARAFNLNSEGKPSIEYGSPAGTLPKIADLKEWALAKDYKGNIFRLQTRIFERGTITVNDDYPRSIFTNILTQERVDNLIGRLRKPIYQDVSSELIKEFAR